MSHLIKQNPELNRDMIQNYVGLANFQKGERYAAHKAVRHGQVKSRVLTALCQGREFDPYHVEAILGETGIEQSYCSCPVGATGKCKHVAALLLSWLDQPDLFSQLALKEQLKDYKAETLIELIDLLTDQIEDSGEIIQAFQHNLQLAHSPSLAKYFRKIEEAFQVSKLPWYHPDESEITEICFALTKIRSEADQLFKEGHVEEAIRLNQALIQRILSYLDEQRDLWGYLSGELRGCVLNLERILQAKTVSEEERLKIMQILFKLIEEQPYRDTEIGSEEAKRVILEQAKVPERDRLIAWIEAIQATYAQDATYENREKILEDFLIDLQRDLLEPDVYLSHYRQTGQTQKLVDSLLRLGRVKEAKQEAEKVNFPSQLLPLVDLFVKYQQPAIAEELVLPFTKRNEWTVFRWLKQFYVQRREDEQALNYALKLFYLSPQLTYYQDCQEIAQAVGKKREVRQQIISYLKDFTDSFLLVEIYLEDNSIKAAIDAFEALAPHGHFRDIHYSLLALRLASACRQKYPEITLRIYQQAVQDLIEERNRESYQKACDYLKLIRSIYSDLQQMDTWELYVKNLMQTYYRLKALRDELYRNNLLF